MVVAEQTRRVNALMDRAVAFASTHIWTQHALTVNALLDAREDVRTRLLRDDVTAFVDLFHVNVRLEALLLAVNPMGEGD